MLIIKKKRKKLTTTNVKPAVYWIGSVPVRCEVSNLVIRSEFVDGPSRGQFGGLWGILHPSYYKKLGGSFGPGIGQLYQLQTDGRWLKIRG